MYTDTLPNKQTHAHADAYISGLQKSCDGRAPDKRRYIQARSLITISTSRRARGVQRSYEERVAE